MRILSCLIDQHDYFLTGLAALICVLGSWVTLRLFEKLRGSAVGARMTWTFLGAISGGATIWCTHFVAMLAYQPGAETTYEPVLTGVSLAVAVIGVGAALVVGTRRSRPSAVAGGVLFGLATAAMHYTGMAAFTADALVSWHAAYVIASVLAAAAGGALTFDLARRGLKGRQWALVPGAMVLTIVALHFTGMGALDVVPLAPLDGAATGETARGLLAAAVASVAFLILSVALASQALEEQSRRIAQKRLSLLIEGSVDGMLVEGDEGVLIVNAAFAELCGAPASALIGRRVSQWIDQAEDMPGGALIQSELKAVDGTMIPVEVAVRRERRDDGVAGDARIFAVRDLRARLAQERRIAHLARNDSLTGLPNRASFLEKLERHVALVEPGRRFALLAMDLDRFKEINDIYGHAVGDQVLVHVAGQMKDAVREGEFVARLGGDEFVAIVPIDDRIEAFEAAERLRAAALTPMQAEHAELQCGASIGIALWPDDATEPSVLINDADLAMYRAKASLTDDICFYEGAMDEAVRERRRITQGLREALDQERFELHYQVQASLETGKVTGFEALLRWPQADGKFISPADFIPIAEETGLILQIGEWVLRRACAEAAAWTEPHKIAVNLSPVQLSHTDLPRLVHQVLLESGLSPSRLELEITETAMISDLTRTTHVLRQLKGLGVSIAMDDFGTGYSSLSTLRAFPFDKIKLDRSFMSEVDASPQSRAIIRAVLALGESLDIPVLAEGVETSGQLAFLREQGCNEAQGYLLGRPARDTQAAGGADVVVIPADMLENEAA